MSEFEPKKTESRPLRFVAVHLGVSHVGGEEKSLEFAKKICEEIMLQQENVQDLQACEKCEVRPRGNITAESAVIQLVKRMEDNPDLNCGQGSNLNMDGQVECDAALMSNKTRLWTGVGAVSGCKNPILLAKSLYHHQGNPRPSGLGQPDFLVGTGAKEWMGEHCPELVIPDGDLIDPRTLSQYQKHKSIHDGTAKEGESGGDLPEKQRQGDEVVNLDSVGAIAVDHEFNFASAVSSGGILLKHKGRIGQAAIPGGGCWADDRAAVVTTVGERSARSLTAKSVVEFMHEARLEFEEKYGETWEEDLHDLEERFNGCVRIPRDEAGENPVGVLAVNTFWGDGYFSDDDGTHLYFHYGHNTDSMCIGYMTREDATGHSIISRQKRERAGKPIVKTMAFHQDCAAVRLDI